MIDPIVRIGVFVQLDLVKPGDSVTIRTPRGNTSGRAVTRRQEGWLLAKANGRHAVATYRNTVSIRRQP